MHRLIILCILLPLAWFEEVPAQAAQDSTATQAPSPLCYRARPKPACSAFLLTNFGSYVVLGRDDINDTRWREVADWGLMANITTRDAIGGSVFASLDRLGVRPRARRPVRPLAPVFRIVGSGRRHAVGDCRHRPATGLRVRPCEVESQRLVCGRGSARARAPLRVSRLWTNHVQLPSAVARARIARGGVRLGARARAHRRGRPCDCGARRCHRRGWGQLDCQAPHKSAFTAGWRGHPDAR